MRRQPAGIFTPLGRKVGANSGLHEPLGVQEFVILRFGVGHEQAMAAFSGLFWVGEVAGFFCDVILFYLGGIIIFLKNNKYIVQ